MEAIDELIDAAQTFYEDARRDENGALHNWGCSWGLNPPVSRRQRVM